MTLPPTRSASIAAVFAAFPSAIIGGMMFMVGFELIKLVRTVSPGRDLVATAVTVLVSLLGNMALGYLAGLAVYWLLTLVLDRAAKTL